MIETPDEESSIAADQRESASATTSTAMPNRQHEHGGSSRHADRVEALADVSSSLARTGLDYHDLLRTVAQRSGQVFGGAALIRLISDDGQRLEIAAVYHPDQRREQTMWDLGRMHPQNMNDGLSGRTLQTGQTIIATGMQEVENRLILKEEYRNLTALLGVEAVLSTPILIGARPLGVLMVMQSTPDLVYGEDDALFLQELAGRAALAIEYARLVRAEQQARHQAEILQAANMALTQTLDQDTILERLLDYLAQLVPYDTANTMRIDENGILHVRSIRGYERWTDPAKVRHLKFDSRLRPNLHQLVNGKESVLIADTHKYPGWEVSPETAHIRSWMGIPLVAGGRIVGLYGVDKAEPDFFTPEHQHLAEALAAQAAVAIENAQLYQAEQEARYQAEILSAASVALIQTLDLDSILATLFDYLRLLVPYDSGTILMLEDENTLRVHSYRGFESWTAANGAPFIAFDIPSNKIMSQLMREGKSVLVPDTRVEPNWQWYEPALHVRSWLGVPLLVGGHVVGVYSLDKSIPSFFTRNHVRLAEGLAAQTSVAIEKSRLLQETQAALQSNRNMAQHLTTLLQSTNSGFYGIDRDVRCTFINRAGAELLGYEADELLGQPMHDIIHHSHADGTPYRLQECPIYSAARSGESCRVDDEVFWRKDGTTIEVGYAAQPIIEDGLPAGAVVSFADVSELKRAAEARRAREIADEANRAKSEFLSRMSHELRTPLNSIIGFTQILQSEETDPERREYMGYVLSGGQHLLSLINEVLDMSRIESGNMVLDTEPIAVDEVLHESLDLVGSLAAERGLQIQIDFQPIRNLYMLADRKRVRQVLLNLLSNAVKYNSEGGSITVSCALEEKLPEHEDEEALATPYVRIKVSDTGPGISADKLPRLFSAFDRLGAEHSGVEGTGLGLILSKRLIELMEGTIGVESTPGVGATFWIDLPAVIVEAPAQEASDLALEPTMQHDGAVKLYNILYIEDNPQNRKLLELLLAQRKDIKLRTVPNIVGLDAATLATFDLLLLDLNLPGLSGENFLAQLKADPVTSSIPVVILSADAIAGSVERLIAAGAVYYLTKPLDLQRLMQVIDEVLSGA